MPTWLLSNLILWEIAKDKVYCLSTDNAAYYKAAHKLLIREYGFSNLEHITCWSHILNLAANQLIVSMPILKEFLIAFNVLFRFGKSAAIYSSIIGTNPPKVCETRWGSFLIACKIHYINFDKYPALITNLEKDKKFNTESDSFKSIKKIITIAQECANLISQLNLCFKICDRFIQEIKLTESKQFKTEKIYNSMIDFNSYLLNVENSIKETRADDKSKEEAKDTILKAAINCRSKLKDYLDGKNPGIDLLKAVRYFDPEYLKQSNYNRNSIINFIKTNVKPIETIIESDNQDLKENVSLELVNYCELISSLSFINESALEF